MRVRVKIVRSNTEVDHICPSARSHCALFFGLIAEPSGHFQLPWCECGWRPRRIRKCCASLNTSWCDEGCIDLFVISLHDNAESINSDGSTTSSWISCRPPYLQKCHQRLEHQMCCPYDKESTRRTAVFQDLVGDPEPMPVIGIGIVRIPFSKPAPGALTLMRALSIVLR